MPWTGNNIYVPVLNLPENMESKRNYSSAQASHQRPRVANINPRHPSPQNLPATTPSPIMSILSSKNEVPLLVSNRKLILPNLHEQKHNLQKNLKTERINTLLEVYSLIKTTVTEFIDFKNENLFFTGPNYPLANELLSKAKKIFL